MLSTYCIHSAAKSFFSAWEEFNDVRADSPLPESRDQKIPTNNHSSLQSFFSAYEKFNYPSRHTSHESLSSLASSANSSCSDFSELLAQDATFQAKLYHALQRVAAGVQRPSRLPFAPTGTKPQSELSFEELGMMKKLLMAFHTFVNPPSTENENEDESNPFPKFC